MFKYKILVLFLSVALLVGCTLPGNIITGSGNVVTQEEAINGFDKVEVSHTFNVDISQGETFSVVVNMDDNLLQYLEVVKQGSTLKIGLKTDRISRDSTLEAEVTLPGLTGLNLSGASHANITGFKSTKDISFDLSAASSSRGDIEAGDISIGLSDSSSITLTGSGQDLTIDAKGSSELDLTDLLVVNASVILSDASTATVNASGRLDVDASDASDVYYLGDPTLGEINTSSESSVEPK
jgi:hypothetical protein